MNKTAFLTLALLISILFSCEEDQIPTVTTSIVTDITAASATSGGTVTSEGTEAIIARGVCWSTQNDPTVSDSKTIDGTGIGDFTSILSSLEKVKTYYMRAYATNKVGTGYGDEVSFTTPYGPVTDIDGNIYPTVQIGTKIWMAKNLKTTHYDDRSIIDYVTNSSTWAGKTTGAYCRLQFSFDNVLAYGSLYNWYAVSTGKLCPTGWRVPTDMEWLALTAALGGQDVAGGKMKETGTTNWLSPNTGADNSSGFTAVGGSHIDYNGNFGAAKESAYWWSSTEVNATQASGNKIFYNNAGISQGGGTSKKTGFSIRCIKD